MSDTIRFSGEGTPKWFSPAHAGEKFKEIAVSLAALAFDAGRKKNALAKGLWEVQAIAEKYARYYLLQSPVHSVRIMQPSGAIFVMLADGREVLVPQPPAGD